MAKSPKQTPVQYRGRLAAPIPGMGAVIRGVMEAREIGRCISHNMSGGLHWMLLYFFTRGRVQLCDPEVPADWLDMAAGQAVLIPPGRQYRIDTTVARERSHHVWMFVESLPDRSPLRAMAGTHKGCAQFVDINGSLAQCFESLLTLVERNRQDPFWCMQLHGREILRVLENSTAGLEGFRVIGEASVPQATDCVVSRVIEYLSRHYTQTVRLPDIARYVGASASTVSHRYRAFAGEPPMQTLRRMRILQAKILLLEGRLTREIAEALGFCDERHLWTAFKQMEGMSPSEFLRRARNP